MYICVFQCHVSKNVYSDKTNVSVQRRKWDLYLKDGIFCV